MPARPVFLVRHTLVADQPPTGAWLKAKLTLHGVGGQDFYYQTNGLLNGTVLQIALQANATLLATGRYDYRIDLTPSQGTVPQPLTGQVNIVNGQASEFGEGWSLDGLHRLHLVSGGAILDVGRGLSLWFANAGVGTFTRPTGDFSTLALSGNVYTRTLKDGQRKGVRTLFRVKSL